MPTFRDNDGSGKDTDPNAYGDILGEFAARNKLNLRFGQSSTPFEQAVAKRHEEAETGDERLTMADIQAILADEEAEFGLTMEDEEGESTDFSLLALLELEEQAYLVLGHEAEDTMEILFARCEEQADGSLDFTVLEDGEEMEAVKAAFEEAQSDDAEMTLTFNFVNEAGEPDSLELMRVMEVDGRQYGVMSHADEDGGMEIIFVHYWEDEDGTPQIADIEDDEEYERVDRFYDESLE
ncbi:MAG TPA: hypothetical protein DCF42_01090 [Lachnospiraceae bacterium]|nr:hypothetical protein [Lachnospiraceae bacterium]